MKKQREAEEVLAAELVRVRDVERGCLSIYNDILKKVRARQVPPEKFAETIEKRVLPPWNEEKARLDALKLGEPQDTEARRFAQVHDAAIEGWTLIAQGARTNDNGLMTQGFQKHAAAAKIFSVSTPPTPEEAQKPRSLPDSLLKAAAHGRDALGVEAEPVHPSDVAGVLDLDAAIHDDGEAARLGDARAFLVDHRELAPEAPGADRHRLRGDRGQRVRRAKDVDDVHGTGHVDEALEALLAEDLRLARVHRNDAVAVAFEVEPDEVARAQLILRQPDDRDRLRAVERRAGWSADPDSALRSNDAVIGTPPRSPPARDPREALFEVPDQIVDGFDADRQPDGSRADAGRAELIVVELPMRRAGRMDDEALRIADVGEVRPQASRRE